MKERSKTTWECRTLRRLLIEGVQFGADLLTLLQRLPGRVAIAFEGRAFLNLVTLQLIVGFDNLG